MPQRVVVVSVRGGIAETIYRPAGIDVLFVDLDDAVDDPWIAQLFLDALRQSVVADAAVAELCATLQTLAEP